MGKRRTSGIQRRERASSDAFNRRLDEPRRPALPDWRLLAIGALLAVGLVLVIVALIFSAAPNPNAGVAQPDAGALHVPPGDCRAEPASCGLDSDPYSSVPATSGPHWDTPANWGVYSTPQVESQLIHNLEHGGIVIWYDAASLDDSAVQTLAQFVESQVASGIGGRFKFILTPWGGEQDLPAPIVVTSWRYLLTLDEPDTGAIDDFASARYGDAPEPAAGPPPPGG